MKKIILLMFCMILLVGTVSAFEFDNVKDYDPITKTITITNAFGLGDKIAEVQLNTPINNYVPRGYQKVAEFEVRSNGDYNNAFKELELFDKKKGMNKFLRDYDFKSLSYETIIINDYGSILTGYSSNGTAIYETQIIGTHEEQRQKWTKLTPADFKKNDIVTIGIFTDVQKGDVIEWIPNFFGVRIDEWAVWTEDLNVGLISYYRFNETSGAVLDSAGTNNGTNNGALRGVPGIIGNAFNYSGTDWVSVPDVPALDFGGNDFSISAWVNVTSIATEPIAGTSINSGNRGFVFYTTTQLNFLGSLSGGAWDITMGGGTISIGTWHNVILVRDGSAWEIFIDGISVDTTSNAGSLNNEATPFKIGRDFDSGGSFFNGKIDEYGIWNRSLNSSEITDLYNGGAGITFRAVFNNPPNITLNTPANDTKQTTNSLTFNCSATDDLGELDLGVLNLSLIIDGVINTTIFNSTANQNLSLEQTLNFVDGDYNWTCNGFDADEDEGTTETRIFGIDTIIPNVDVTSPTGDQGTFVSGRNLTLIWTASDTNLDTCFYDYAGSNTTVTCGDGATNLTVTDSTLTSLVFYANDTFGHINSSSTSWSYSFIENNITFNVNVSETSSQTFTLNLTTTVNILSISSVLTYNGTDDISISSCDGDNCTISNTIDVPLVTSGESHINNFFWNFTIFNGSDSINIVTFTRTQNASRIHLEICNATFTTQTLNFTTFDEQNLSRISPFIFDGTFDFWLGSGTVMRNNSFSENITELNLCIIPNATMKTDATINYDEDSNLSLYTDRFYYFDDKQINNISQDIDMYLLRSAASTSFILKVQDENLLPIADALIEIHRFYPGEGIFRIVQIAKTDDNGKSIGFFETETVDYKFIIKKAGVTLLETGQQKVIPETSPFTLTFNTGTNLGEPWKSQNPIPSLNSTLTWNSNTGIVTYIYIDTSTNFTQARLLVQQQSLSNSTAYVTICNDTLTLSSATITCSVGNSSGFYIASAFITRTAEALDRQITFQIETFSSVVDLTGLFLGFFLIVISSFMFKFNEVAGIWGVTMTIFLINIMGLIKFGAVFVTAILGIAIILTWVMEK